jgi:iron complex outermembrane receptor protein
MSKRWNLLALLATTGIAAAATPALAQTDKSTTAVGEVIVTAQRRQENLHDVPIAVSVVSADKLASSNLTGLTDVSLLVPDLTYNAYLGGGFQVRGVGTQSVNLTTEQDVGVVIDDIVQGLPELTFAAPSYQALTDIDRIEVLKGPQGTLFGKNSSVGVVQIVTKKPELDVVTGDASITAASHGEYNVFANLNVPVGQTAAILMSAFEYHQDGFIKNEFNGQWLGGYDQYGVRGKVLWDPTSNLSIYLIAEYMKTSSPGNGAWTLRSCGSGFSGFSACATDAPYGVVPGPNNQTVALDASTPAETETGSASLHIDYKIGPDTLSLITGFIHMNSFENVDVDNSPRPILNLDNSLIHSQEFTQEVRLTSPSNQRFEYTIGAYYYNTNSNYFNELAGTFGFLPDNSPILLSNGFAGLVSGGQTELNASSQSYAVYGQATWHVVGGLQLIGGVRFTHDDVGANVHVNPYPGICEFGYAFGGPCHSVSLPSPIVYDSASASNVSGKVTVKYDFTSDVNAYFTFATGYKGPAISYGALLPFSPVQPETSTDYELGLKSQLFDHHLSFNVELFYEKYKDFQADTFVINQSDPSASNFELANAGGLESKGVEADATWAPIHNLTFNASVAYNPTKFTDFVIQCQTEYANPPMSGTCYTVDGASLFNAKGYPLPQAPEWSYTLSADYRHSVSDKMMFDGHLVWTWRDSTYSLVADRNTIQGGYGLLNGELGIGPRDGLWRISVFGRNMLNQHFVAAIFPSFLDAGPSLSGGVSTLGYSNVPSVQSLQTFGAKLDFKFR